MVVLINNISGGSDYISLPPNLCCTLSSRESSPFLQMSEEDYC